jgi:cytochrome c2
MRNQVMGLGAAVLLAATVASAADAPEVYEKKCKACHSIKGDGGKMADKGGALDGIGAKHDAAWLKAYIEDPKSKMPDAKMPKLKLAPEEIDALVGYLGSLK